MDTLQVNSKNMTDAWRAAYDLRNPEVIDHARKLELEPDKMAAFLKSIYSTPSR